MSIQGPHARRADKDTRMNSRGCWEGPIENAHVQGPEFCATPLVTEETKFIWEHSVTVAL